jgi:hypothetical protein
MSLATIFFRSHPFWLVLWWYLEENVRRNRSYTVDKPKEEMWFVSIRIIADNLSIAVANFQRRQDLSSIDFVGGRRHDIACYEFKMGTREY